MWGLCRRGKVCDGTLLATRIPLLGGCPRDDKR